jgi:MFS family permease
MSTQPTFGRVFTFSDAEPTYLIMLLIFEIGSLICATAPNSIALIIGRALPELMLLECSVGAW